MPIRCKGREVAGEKPDLLVEGRLIVETKVVEQFTDVHRAQCVSYLSATQLNLALPINFNVAVLKDGIRRVIRTGSLRA
jgi:GxxExxY protein